MSNLNKDFSNSLQNQQQQQQQQYQNQINVLNQQSNDNHNENALNTSTTTTTSTLTTLISTTIAEKVLTTTDTINVITNPESSMLSISILSISSNEQQQQQIDNHSNSSSNIDEIKNNNIIHSSSSTSSLLIMDNSECYNEYMSSFDDHQIEIDETVVSMNNNDVDIDDNNNNLKQQNEQIQSLFMPVNIENNNNNNVVHDENVNNNDNDDNFSINPIMITTSKAITNFVLEKNEKKKLKRLEKQKLRQQQKQQQINKQNLIWKKTYWNYMPIDIIEKIFQLLSIKERHIASQVCPHWFECFYLPSIWTTLVMTDITFTKRKFNYYLGYQRMIDPFKTQTFLWKFGTSIRRLIIKPMSNFFNLYEFMKILSQFAQHYEPNRLSQVNTLDFTFGCRSIINNDHFDDHHRRLSTGDLHIDDSEVIGTGGKLLEALKELMYYLIGLKHLALRDLLLNTDEARYLLDNVAINCYEQLRTLTLINCCKNQCAFLHAGIFINLDTLVISCQHLDEDVIILLASNQSLNHLYIVQTELTRSQGPLSLKLWKKFLKINCSQIQIHLVMVNRTNRCRNLLSYEMALQPTNVKSIIYDAPIIRPSCTRLIEIAQLYGHCLECIAFYHLPKYSIRRSYQERIDTFLIYLSQHCTQLQTIIINDLISTTTLLLIVTFAKNIKKLYVRRNAIRKRFDCIINPSWRENFIKWLRKTSRSYDQTFSQISNILGYKWIPLSDDQFKRLKPNVCL